MENNYFLIKRKKMILILIKCIVNCHLLFINLSSLNNINNEFIISQKDNNSVKPQNLEDYGKQLFQTKAMVAFAAVVDDAHIAIVVVVKLRTIGLP